jgi:hypothetical protein
VKKFTFHTSGIQPEDGYFGTAETSSCNLQMLQQRCALTGYVILSRILSSSAD